MFRKSVKKWGCTILHSPKPHPETDGVFYLYKPVTTRIPRQVSRARLEWLRQWIRALLALYVYNELFYYIES
jgi:hypothetical protein